MLDLVNVSKTYRSNNGVNHRALNGINLSFPDKGLCFIIGKSGCGKTTLLNVIGATDTFDGGDIVFNGQSFKNFKKSDFDAYRNTFVGFVYQDFNLLDVMTVRENIAFALSLQGKKDKALVQKVIDDTEIGEFADRIPSTLSGGQCQRVAIARALVKNPKILLADEPTGSLDSATGNAIMQLLVNESKKRLVIVVTHDRETADLLGERIIELKDGRIYKDLQRVNDAVESRVDVVGNTLIRVPNGETVDDETVATVNSILKQNLRDNYIISEQNVEKVKSMNQHIQNAVVINDDKKTTNFIPYRKNTDEIAAQNVFIKTHMPFKECFALTKYNLKKKKGLLALTSILLILVLVLTGLIVSVNTYNLNSSVAKTAIDENVGAMLLIKNQKYYTENSFSDSEIAELKNYTSEAKKFYTVPEGSLRVADIISTDTVVSNGIRAIVEVDDVTKLGYTMLAGSSTPSENGIILTDYMLNELNKFSSFYGDNPQASLGSYVGKSIKIGEKTFTIDGIIKTDSVDMIREYNEKNYGVHSESYASAMLLSYYETSLGILYCKTGNKEKIIKETDTTKNLVSADGNTVLDYIVPFNDSTFGDVTKYTVDETGVIYITSSTFHNVFGYPNTETDEEYITAKITEFNNSGKDFIVTNSYSINDSSHLTYGVINNLKIIGVIDSYSLYGTFMNEEAYSEFKDKITESGLLVNVNASKRSVKKMLDYAESQGYYPVGFYTSDYTLTSSSFKSIAKTLTKTMWWLFAVVTILLFVYIRSGIKSSRKQFGIVRALGAGAKEIIGIYAIESYVITFSVMLLSSIILIGLMPAFEALSTKVFGFHISLIGVTPLTFVALIGGSFTVATLAVVLVIRKLFVSAPADVIHKGQ